MRNLRMVVADEIAENLMEERRVRNVLVESELRQRVGISIFTAKQMERHQVREGLQNRLQSRQ